MPFGGDDVPLEPGDPKKPGTGYRQHFEHQTEIAQPGYYAVTLTDSKVRAEMTAGTRVGVHRYTFPAGQAAHLVLALRTSLYNYPGKVLWSSIRLLPERTITGTRQTHGWAPDRQISYTMTFSAPPPNHPFLHHAKELDSQGL